MQGLSVLKVIGGCAGLGGLVIAASLAFAQPTPPTTTPAKPATSEQPQPRQGGPGGPGGQQPGGGRGPGGGRDGAPANVEGAMKMTNRGIKMLEKQLSDTTKKEENLKLIADAQRGIIYARNLVPRGPWVEETDSAKKYAALVPYRKHLIDLERKMIDLEVAIMDDKIEVAKAAMKEIQKMKDDGHKEMGVKDEENFGFR